MTIAQWSTTAANNASGVTGINWAEGQAPSTVNNSSRQEMADVANWYRNTAEFIDRDDSAAFSSAAKIKFTGTDLTGIYKVGRRIFTTSSTPGTLHGRITASSFSTDTTVTISFDSTAVLANEAISDVQVGIISGSTNSSVHVEAIDGMPAFTASKRGALLLQNGDDDGYTLLTSQGSSGQVLKSNGADADPSFAAQTSATWLILQTQTSTGVAELDFTSSIDSTFDTYAFVIAGIVPAVDNKSLQAFASTDAGTSFMSTSGSYKYHNTINTSDTGTQSAEFSDNDGTSNIPIGSGVGSSTGESMSGILYLNTPSNTSIFKGIHGQMNGMNASGNLLGKSIFATVTNKNAINGIRFKFSGANIASGGRITMFGIAHS